MAKLSSINKNNRRRKLSDRFYAKRKKLKVVSKNEIFKMSSYTVSYAEFETASHLCQFYD